MRVECTWIFLLAKYNDLVFKFYQQIMRNPLTFAAHSFCFMLLKAVPTIKLLRDMKNESAIFDADGVFLTQPGTACRSTSDRDSLQENINWPKPK